MNSELSIRSQLTRLSNVTLCLADLLETAATQDVELHTSITWPMKDTISTIHELKLQEGFYVLATSLSLVNLSIMNCIISDCLCVCNGCPRASKGLMSEILIQGLISQERILTWTVNISMVSELYCCC